MLMPAPTRKTKAGYVEIYAPTHPTERLRVQAYDASGNNRPFFLLEEGDVIEWKRNGHAGFCHGRVTCIAARSPSGEERSKPIRILPLNRFGGYHPTGERERWIGRNAVMRVYERDGKSWKLPDEFDQADLPDAGGKVYR